MRRVTARRALSNRLLRILRKRAQAHESGARERDGHDSGALNTQKVKTMRRRLFATGLAALTVGVAACGGYGSSSPTGPGNPPPADAITINVVRENGNQSFSPNPATVPPGATVVWHNIDTTIHRVVLNDSQLDTGNISPGAFSAPMTLNTPRPYHCSIHPDMVGTIQGGQ
jgi:plastocyanin